MKYQPPYGGQPNDPYVTGNPATNTQGSIPSGQSIEYPMREIVNAITAAGLIPNDNDLTQLGQSITAIANARLAAAFSSNHSVSTPWYQSFPGGLLVQSGVTANIPVNQIFSVTFPQNFSNNPHIALMALSADLATGENNPFLTALSVSGFSAEYSRSVITNFSWLAIGF